MRVLQIIDSLEPGGAERMAVNYANALSERIEFSGLVATRAEGNLKGQLNGKVSYFFLKRKKTLDIRAVVSLKKYCQTNQVEHLHAHSSSYFIAFLVKVIHPKIKIIWHDHNGLSEFESVQKPLVLKGASLFFKGIIVVNFKLKNWATDNLYCKNIVYLPNFTNKSASRISETKLKGAKGKRILCLANLRSQKNHFLLLEVAEKFNISHPDWTFHLVGKDFADDYSLQIKNTILEKKLENIVFVYGSKSDVSNIIDQVDITVFTSKSEGFPVSLIECGLGKRPVVSTNVGEIPLIIQEGKNGYGVPSGEVDLFYQKLKELADDESLRIRLGNSLYQTIADNYSEQSIVGQYFNWIEEM